MLDNSKKQSYKSKTVFHLLKNIGNINIFYFGYVFFYKDKYHIFNRILL